MDTQMKIDADTVRTVREAKSWSPEHLASASGLSARTVQRVEAVGLGSAETRLALAAALGVPVSRLIPLADAAQVVSREHRRGRFWGWLRWSIGGISSATGIIVGAALGDVSPGAVGASLGMLGALLGISAALIGGIDFWIRKRGSAI